MPKPETEFTHLSDDALSRIGFFLSDTDRGRLASVNRQSFAVLGFSGYVKRVFGIDLSTFPLQALFFDASMVSERPEQLQLLRVLSLQEDYWQYAIVSDEMRQRLDAEKHQILANRSRDSKIILWQEAVKVGNFLLVEALTPDLVHALQNRRKPQELESLKLPAEVPPECSLYTLKAVLAAWKSIIGSSGSTVAEWKRSWIAKSMQSMLKLYASDMNRYGMHFVMLMKTAYELHPIMRAELCRFVAVQFETLSPAALSSLFALAIHRIDDGEYFFVRLINTCLIKTVDDAEQAGHDQKQSLEDALNKMLQIWSDLYGKQVISYRKLELLLHIVMTTQDNGASIRADTSRRGINYKPVLDLLYSCCKREADALGLTSSINQPIAIKGLHLASGFLRMVTRQLDLHGFPVWDLMDAQTGQSYFSLVFAYAFSSWFLDKRVDAWYKRHQDGKGNTAAHYLANISATTVETLTREFMRFYHDLHVDEFLLTPNQAGITPLECFARQCLAHLRFSFSDCHDVQFEMQGFKNRASHWLTLLQQLLQNEPRIASVEYNHPWKKAMAILKLCRAFIEFNATAFDDLLRREGQVLTDADRQIFMKLGSLLGIDSPGQYFESDVFSASLVDMALSSIEQLLDREENKKRQAEAAAASTDGAEKSLPEPKRIHLSQSNSLLFPKLASTKRDHSQFADERGEQQVKRLNARGYPAVSGLRLPHWQPPQPHDESDEDDIDAGPAPAA